MITFHPKSLDELADYFDLLAKREQLRAETTKLKREAFVAQGAAHAYRDAAFTLRNTTLES